MAQSPAEQFAGQLRRSGCGGEEAAMSFGAMLEVIGFVLYLGGAVLFGIDLIRGKTPSQRHGWLIFFSTGRAALVQVAGEACWLVHKIMEHNIFGAVLNGVWIAGLLYSYFKHGGGKGLKKAALELGEKSKARIQELVDNLTPSPIPSPVGAR
jgi:hypothetical protein